MTLRFFRWQTLSGYVLLALLLSFMLPAVQAQDTNLCRDGGAFTITYDETLTGTLSTEFPFQFYCFDAERGDNVTVSVEATSGGIVPAVVVATPFLDATSALVDEPLAEGLPEGNETAIAVSANIDSDGTYLIIVQTITQAEGTFDITIEAQGGAVLGGSDATTEDTDDTDEATADTDIAVPDDAPSSAEIIPGQTNLCNTTDTLSITMGDTVEASLATDGFPSFACFDAEAGDIVSIEAATTEGGAAMAFVLVSPFYDFTQTAPTFGQGLAASPEEVAALDFFVRESGTYVILILSANGQLGSFSLSIDSEVGTIYTCDNEPLSLITTATWGVFNDTDDAPILQINIGCSDLLAVSTLGQSEVSSYFIEQDNTFLFAFQETVFTTVSLTADEWVIEDATSTARYTLTPLTDPDQCTDEFSLALLRGSWEWSPAPTQTIILDFTCDGIVIVDDLTTEERFAAPYTITEDGETVSLDVGGLPFDNVEITAESISANFQGESTLLTNRLFDSSTEDDDSETDAETED